MNAFDELRALRHLRVDQNNVNCDCATHDFVRRMESKGAQTDVVCATPIALRGRTIEQLNANDLKCDGQNQVMVKLLEEDSRTMFVCEVDENLTLDAFETSNAENDEELSVENLGIQNFAANIFGEHNCIYDFRSVKEPVKLMVTTEINNQNDIIVNTKFNAEILVPAAIANDVNANAEILIQCPNSGKPDGTMSTLVLHDNFGVFANCSTRD